MTCDRHRILRAVIVSILTLRAIAASAQSRALPLIVEQTRVVPSDPATGAPPGLEVIVYNIADRAIVAAGVNTEITFADGVVHRGGTASDGVESVDLPQKRGLIIVPNGKYVFLTHSWPTGRGEKDVVAAKAEPMFLIFSDDTGLGDEATISHYFKARQENHRAWPVVDRIFADAVASNPNARHALVAAQREIQSLKDGDLKNSDPVRWAEFMLSINLKISRPDDAPLLQMMLDEIHTRRLANEAHYVRRK